MSVPRRLVAAGLVAAVVAGVAACGGGSGSDEGDGGGSGGSGGSGSESGGALAGTGGSKCTEERRGGELTVAVPSFTLGLDPMVALGSAVHGGTETTAIYGTLLRFDPETGEYEGHLAESLEGSEDSTEWTLTLRDGVTFGDGTPVTAEAVRFSVERMKDSTANSGGLAQEVASMEVVDDRTIVFRLARPWGTFPYVLAEEAGMVVNPAVASSVGADELNTAPPPGAGAGPYVVERFARDEEVVLRAKDDWWGGPVCIERLRFVSVPGGDATYEAFRSGEVQAAILTDDRARADAEADGVEGYGQAGGLGTMLVMNNGRTPSPTEDQRVREAAALALDLDVLNDRVYGGAAEVGSSVMPAGSPVYGGEGPPHDPSRAAELVEEAKADGWDGEIEILGNDTPVHAETLITVEAMLESVGFEVEVRNVPTAELNRLVIAEGRYEMALYGPVVLEESTVVDMTQFEAGSPSNRLGYADADMDAAVSLVRSATDRSSTRSAMEAVQAAWNATIPSANMFMSTWWWALDPSLRGIVWTRDVTPVFDTAWLDG
jgi:peptide/nickel transport system substrate-binding protein